ncbi:MAG: phosphate ABC transporter substrate-binding protein PstS [Candidatus Lambdaproteobacteria bacterium]|nr:phosphate ABC transporter substrate-binding protein PstS [Candidatus Lambdaproteobacteria bacterium]
MMMNRFPALATVLGLAAALAALAGRDAQARDITGAGATFPYPIYARWADAYSKETGVRLNYQSIGSGGGIAQIKARTVNFGASDLPLTPAQLDAAGLIQFPTVVGGVVPVVKLSGIRAGELKLTPEVLAGIFLGRITRWNDAALVSLNAGRPLPDKAITVVHRSDGSGTTAIFTNYLSKVSPAWKAQVGSSTSVRWPAGLGGKGNEGVAAYVQQIEGSIGYVELAYALQNNMTSTLLRNRAGGFVAPSIATFASAAGYAEWDKAAGFYLMLTDQPGETTWPISGATFILMHKRQANPETAREVLKFFAWCYENGDEMAKKLDYVPLPGNVVQLIRQHWQANLRGGDGNVVWR